MCDARNPALRPPAPPPKPPAVRKRGPPVPQPRVRKAPEVVDLLGDSDDEVPAEKRARNS